MGGGPAHLQAVLAVDLAPVRERQGSESGEGISAEWDRVAPTGGEESVLPAGVSAGAMAGGLAGKSDYVSSRELSQRASPVAPVIVPFPDVVAGKRNGVVVLQLELSERGDVDAVKVVESDLPDGFGDVARKAFQAARFHPGIKDGHSVPVRMKIEVRFSEGS